MTRFLRTQDLHDQGIKHLYLARTCKDPLSTVDEENKETMGKAILPKREGPRPHAPRSQKRRVSTADLMQGAREIILLHGGEEYVLRITKAGKLILTK